MMGMKMFLIGLAVGITCMNAHAAEVRSSLQSGVEVKPGEQLVIAIQSQKPIEIGWTVDPAAPCQSPCIEAIDMSNKNKDVLFSATGASKLYKPIEGTIKIEFRNTIGRTVMIDLYTIKRLCDSEAEACEFLKLNELGDRLVYKVEKFTSIQTSKDGSYSTIEGSTTRGKFFLIKVVWWFDDSENTDDHCLEDITRYVQNAVPISQYSPYILSGRSAARDKSVLVNVDTCVPKGFDFAVPEKYIY